MKAGIITDSHLGINDDLNHDIIESLNRIKSYFKSNNIKNVVHLGDMIHESDDTRSDIRKVTQIFSDFNKYMAIGNHDIINAKVSDFEEFGWTCSGIIEENNNRIVKIVDTSSKSKYDNMGYIPETEIKNIKNILEKNKDLYIITHYPLEKIYESEVFESIPERAYPINKSELFIKCDHREYRSNIKNVFCGHQHPNRTRQFKGQPSSMNITVFEPIINFRINSDGVKTSINEDIDMSNLIVDLD